jgi:Leucine-rich repeat (LRR) protein
MSYTDVVRELLEEQYPDPDSTDTIVISQLVLRILPAPVKPLFLRYHLLETLVLTKCDLRNLDNFPRLVSLKNLDLSDNSLQGSLNYLMPLTSLNYLSLANNLIADHRKLLPLQVIDGL